MTRAMRKATTDPSVRHCAVVLLKAGQSEASFPVERWIVTLMLVA